MAEEEVVKLQAFDDKVKDVTEGETVPASPPGKPGEWELMEGFSDEFSGAELDMTKWDNFHKGWLGRAPGWFNPENVLVENDCLKLRSKVEDPPEGYPSQYHTYSTAFMRSKKMVKYGYFEVYVQPADSITSSSFWFEHNDKENWNEIDTFELSTATGHEKTFHMNIHVFRVDGEDTDPDYEDRDNPAKYAMDFKVSQPFVAGLEWDENNITWTVNGEVVRKEPNKHWHSEMFVQFDSETMGDFFGLPSVDDERLPAIYKIFYIRAWRKISD